MDDCYSLLGVVPTATTDEIEEAYQRKRLEFGLNWPLQTKLDNAYNEAMMATFAPIRAFSSPLPPLNIGKKPASQQAALAEPPQTNYNEPAAEQFPQFSQAQAQAQTQAAQAPPVQPAAPRVSYDAPVQSAYQPSPHTSYTGGAVAQEVQALVEEVPVSFTDVQLMNMNVSELRENYMSLQEDEEDTDFLTLGIENKLLRFYAKTYIVVTFLDIVMRLWVGTVWLHLADAGEWVSVSTPFLWSILFACASVFYFFVCSLPFPFAMRFFVIGQPPDKSGMRWALLSLAIALAFLLRWLFGRFLPADVNGSVLSLAFISMALGLKTLLYGGE